MPSLIVMLGLDSRSFAGGLNTNVAKARTAGQQIKNALGAAEGALGARVAGLISGIAFTSMIRQVTEYSSKINDLSNALNEPTDVLQKLDYALKQTGSSMDDGAKVLKELAKARKEALEDPNSDAAKAFDKFGVSPQMLRDTDRASDLWLRLGDHVKKAGLNVNQLPAMLDLTGRSGMSVIPAMTEGLRELGEEAVNLGQILDDDVIKKFDAGGDKFDQMMGRIRKPLAEIGLFFVKWGDTIQTGIQLAFNKVVETVALIAAKIAKLFPGGEEKSQRRMVEVEAARAEIDRIKTEFLDRYDPAKQTPQRGKFIPGLDDDPEAIVKKQSKKAQEKRSRVNNRTDVNELQRVGAFIANPNQTLETLQRENNQLQKQIARNTEKIANMRQNGKGVLYS